MLVWIFLRERIFPGGTRQFRHGGLPPFWLRFWLHLWRAQQGPWILYLFHIRVKISQAITGLLARYYNHVTALLTWWNRIGKITVLFNVSTYCYSLGNRQGLFVYVRTCKTRFERTGYFHINNFILLTRSRAKQHQLLFYHIISVIYVLFVDENTQF